MIDYGNMSDKQLLDMFRDLLLVRRRQILHSAFSRRNLIEQEGQGVLPDIGAEYGLELNQLQEQIDSVERAISREAC